MSEDHTRRTLLKAAAWATPTVAVAVAAPFAAASGAELSAFFSGEYRATPKFTSRIALGISNSGFSPTPATATISFTSQSSLEFVSFETGADFTLVTQGKNSATVVSNAPLPAQQNTFLFFSLINYQPSGESRQFSATVSVPGIPSASAAGTITTA